MLTLIWILFSAILFHSFQLVAVFCRPTGESENEAKLWHRNKEGWKERKKKVRIIQREHSLSLCSDWLCLYCIHIFIGRLEDFSDERFCCFCCCCNWCVMYEVPSFRCFHSHSQFPKLTISFVWRCMWPFSLAIYYIYRLHRFIDHFCMKISEMWFMAQFEKKSDRTHIQENRSREQK